MTLDIVNELRAEKDRLSDALSRVDAALAALMGPQISPKDVCKKTIGPCCEAVVLSLRRGAHRAGALGRLTGYHEVHVRRVLSDLMREGKVARIARGLYALT